jgi:hypothetical protein
MNCKYADENMSTNPDILFLISIKRREKGIVNLMTSSALLEPSGWLPER